MEEGVLLGGLPWLWEKKERRMDPASSHLRATRHACIWLDLDAPFALPCFFALQCAGLVQHRLCPCRVASTHSAFA